MGRLSGTKGTVWQYTAIDVASGFAWAELHTSPKNPAAKHCSGLVARVTSELAAAGWRLEAAITDNGSEFRAGSFVDALDSLGVEQRRIRARRPTIERTRRATAADDPRRVLAARLQATR